MKDEYLIASITDDTPLEYIIPTTTEAGACTTALVDFLTLTHNDFIERCQSLILSQKLTYKHYQYRFWTPPVYIFFYFTVPFNQHGECTRFPSLTSTTVTLSSMSSNYNPFSYHTATTLSLLAIVML